MLFLIVVGFVSFRTCKVIVRKGKEWKFFKENEFIFTTLLVWSVNVYNSDLEKVKDWKTAGDELIKK